VQRSPGLFVHFVVIIRASTSAESATWMETFGLGRLDPAGWEVIADSDFWDRAVDVIDVKKTGCR